MSTPYPIKIYDVRPEGHNSLGTLPRLGEDELERLQAFYNFEIDHTYGYERAKPGELYWRIAGFELKAGPSILQPQVWDQNGQLIITPPGILLYLSWAGADPFQVDVDPPYGDRGVGGFTEGKGSVGWGFGPDSHITPEGGPFTVWASSDPPNWADRRVGSDAVRKLGWWDDHIIPNPIFQVTRKAGGSLPPEPGTEYLANVDASGTITGHIPFVPGPPPSGKAALGLVRDGQVVAHVAWE